MIDPVCIISLRSRIMHDQASWLLHVVGKGNLAVLVTDDREGQLAARDLVDVLDPATMALDRVGGETDELGATLGEFWLELCKGTELSCANRSVVLWMREQNHPLVANEVVEVDLAVGGLSIEVRGDAAQAEWLNTIGTHCDVLCDLSGVCVLR